MFFFARDHKARAHGVIARFTVQSTAIPYSDTAQRSVRHVPVVIRELEVRWRLPWLVSRPQAQVLIGMVWVNHLPGIHLPIRIPDGFELAECLDQFGTKHLVQK